MRAKPYVTSHASCGVSTTCHLHRLSYPHRYKSGTFSFYSYIAAIPNTYAFLLPNYLNSNLYFYHTTC